MRRVLVALSLLAAALALFVALGRDGGGGGALSPGAREERGAAPARAEAPARPVEPVAPVETRVPADVVEEPAEPRRPAAADEPPPPLESGGLRVRVVDAAGAPAPGVEVALELTAAGFDGEETLATGTTRAPDGLARLALDELADKRRMAEAMQLQLDFRVAARVASASPVRAKLAGWPADGDEARLELPPTGSLLVRVRHADGAPYTGPAQVYWWWLPADVAAAEPNEAFERVSDHAVQAERGEARVDRLGLGLALDVHAWAPGFVGASARDVEGPRAAGEVRALELRLGAAMARLRVRVLDVAGAPLRSTRLRGELWSDPERVPHPLERPPRPSHVSLETDAEGYAELERAPEVLEVAPRLDVERRARDVDPERDETWCVGSVRLPASLAPGELVELGEVALAPVPTVAEGRVVDASGAPIAGADLRFHERLSSGHRYQDFGRSQRTDARGRFALRATRLPRELAVTVSAKGHATRSELALEPGARGLELVLQPAAPPPPRGSLAVEVLFDRPLDSMRCLLKLERRGGGGRSPDWIAGQRLAIDGLAPGVYDVRVETRDGDFELGRVEGVEVRAEELAEDPRLLPLDLRGTLRTLELELVRPDGSPWRRRDVLVQPLPEGRRFTRETDDEGRAHVLVPSALARLRLTLEGGHAAELPLGPAEGPRRVVLGE